MMNRRPPPESTHRSVRSSTSTTLEPSPELTHRSVQSTTSAAEPFVPAIRRSLSIASTPTQVSETSHYSHSPESVHKPLLRPQQLEPGERIWPNTSHAPGGHRTESKIQRGVVSRAPHNNEAAWRLIVETIISYQFRDPDLLEEALESQGSGVTCVGESHRHLVDGNRGLATVGDGVMKLVLNDQCYLFKISERDAQNIMDQMLSRMNLYNLGVNSKIEQFIRPRKGVRPTQRKNPWALMKDDVQSVGADPTRTIAVGIKAIIGAVYYDGGFESAKRVMAQLDLIIKLPEPKPDPQFTIQYL